jgi:type II secretory pathway predicted ATPase ExeA
VKTPYSEHYLGAVLKKYNLSQKWLAEGIGISRTAITLLINNQAWPKKMKRSVLSQAIKQRLMEGGFQEEEAQKAIASLVNKQDDEHEMNYQLLKRGVAMIPQMVLDKAGLNKDPFTNELESGMDVFNSRQHSYVFQKMMDAAANQKFLGIYGPVGSGKSVIKNLFIDTLNKEKNYMISEPLMIERSKCSPGALCDSMVEDFMYGMGGISALGKMRSPRTLEAKHRLVRAVLANHTGRGKRAVLVIDEAHELPLDTMKALKRFHEHQNGFKKMLAIIVIGQEELFHGLNKDYRVREVTARIDLIELKHIGNVLQDYMKFKIEKAGRNINELFTADALDEMNRKLERPSPIMINVLASHSIMSAFNVDSFPVTPEIVEEAYRKMAS